MNCTTNFDITIDKEIKKKKEFDVNDDDFEGLANATDLESLEHAIIRFGASDEFDCFFGNSYMNENNYLYDARTKEGLLGFYHKLFNTLI